MSSSRSHRFLHVLLAGVLGAGLLAVPAAGYIVFLQDGTQIITKSKYRIEGDKAILVMPSGAETFLNATELDIARTEDFNKINYGTAKVIEGREVRQLRTDETLNKRESLTSYLARTKANLSLPESAPPPAAAAEPAAVAESQGPARTAAGYVDLLAFEKQPYPNSAVREELLQYLNGQGITAAEVYQGTDSKRLLLKVEANSEGPVFKALKDSASALVQLADSFSSEVSLMELLLVTESGQRAGQFQLTPELARILASGALDPARFFLRYVEF